jgi:osmotically-inducible protein OsmY
MKKTLLLFSAAFVLLVLSGCAVLQGSDAAFDPASNEGIAAQAASRLNSDTMTARATLSVSVENGMATLYGTVPDQATRQRAIQIVEGTPGIFDVLDRTRLR